MPSVAVIFIAGLPLVPSHRHILLVARNYKVDAYIGFGKNALRQVNTVLDTGCGPNLPREDQLPPGWRQYEVPQTDPCQLTSASHTAIAISARIRMTVQLGEFAIRTHFLVVPSLAVECILGTAYTNRYVKSIHCIDREVEVLDGTAVPIQAIHGEGSDAPPTTQKEPTPGLRASNSNRVVLSIRIAPLAETEVWVQTKFEGRCFIQGAAKPYDTKGLAVANGVAATKPNQPFRVRIMNLLRTTRLLPKTMVRVMRCRIREKSSPSSPRTPRLRSLGKRCEKKTGHPSWS